MKTASKVMYTLGTIFNIIGIFLWAIFIVLGILTRTFSKDIFERRTAGATYTEADVKIVGTVLMVTGIIAIVITIIVLILAAYARRKLNNNQRDLAPHIIMIVIGVFGSLFYLLGGVFGLVAESDEGQIRTE